MKISKIKFPKLSNGKIHSINVDDETLKIHSVPGRSNFKSFKPGSSIVNFRPSELDLLVKTIKEFELQKNDTVKNVILISGQPGSGKTFLLRNLQKTPGLTEHTVINIIFNNSSSFINSLVSAAVLNGNKNADSIKRINKSRHYARFDNLSFIYSILKKISASVNQSNAGRKLIFVLDDIQNLSPEEHEWLKIFLKIDRRVLFILTHSSGKLNKSLDESILLNLHLSNLRIDELKKIAKDASAGEIAELIKGASASGGNSFLLNQIINKYRGCRLSETNLKKILLLKVKNIDKNSRVLLYIISLIPAEIEYNFLVFISKKFDVPDPDLSLNNLIENNLAERVTKEYNKYYYRIGTSLLTRELVKSITKSYRVFLYNLIAEAIEDYFKNIPFEYLKIISDLYLKSDRVLKFIEYSLRLSSEYRKLCDIKSERMVLSNLIKEYPGVLEDKRKVIIYLRLAEIENYLLNYKISLSYIEAVNPFIKTNKDYRVAFIRLKCRIFFDMGNYKQLLDYINSLKNIHGIDENTYLRIQMYRLNTYVNTMNHRRFVHLYSMLINEVTDLKDAEIYFTFFRIYAKYLYQISDYPKSLQISKMLINRFKDAKSNIEIANIYTRISMIHRFKKEFNEAIKYQLNAHRLFSKYNFLRELIHSSGNLGNLYFTIRNFEKGLMYFKEKINLCKIAGNTKEIAVTYNSLFKFYMHQHDLEKGLFYLLQSESILKSTRSYKSLAYVYSNLSYYFTLTNKYETALGYINRQINIDKKLVNFEGLCSGYLNKADILMKMDRDKDALRYIGKSKKIALSNSILDYVLPILYNNIFIHIKLNNLKKAEKIFKNSNRYIKYNNPHDLYLHEFYQYVMKIAGQVLSRENNFVPDINILNENTSKIKLLCENENAGYIRSEYKYEIHYLNQALEKYNLAI